MEHKDSLLANSFTTTTTGTSSCNIDKLIDKHKYSHYFRVNLLAYTLTEAYSGAIFDAFYIYVVPYTTLYKLTAFETNLFMNSMNMGALISLTFFNQVNQNFNKKKILYVISIISVILLIMQALARSFLQVFVIRFLIGIPLLYFYIYSVSIAVEFFSAQNRGITINIPHMGQGLGSIFVYISLYLADENLSPACLVPTIIISSIIPMLIFILYYYYIDEGPRDLAIHGRTEESAQIIGNIDSFHELSKRKILKIIENINNGSLKLTGSKENVEASYSDLFKEEYFKLTLSVMMCKAMGCMFFDGWCIALPLLISNSNSNSEGKETNIIIQLIIGNIIAFLKPVIAFSSDFESLGRIGFFKLTFVLAGLTCFLAMILDFKLIGLLIGIANLFIGANGMALNNYVSEVYPTKLRATANALLQVFAMIAVIIGVVLYINLSYLSLDITVIVSIIITCIGYAFTNGINIETRGRNID